MKTQDLIGYKSELILGSKTTESGLVRLTLNVEVLSTHLYYTYKVTVNDEVIYEGDDLATAVEVYNTK